MIKILMLFSLIYSTVIYSQNFDFVYEYKICFESNLFEEHRYNSKTGIYEEIKYDRNTFSDTTNVYSENFKAHIILTPSQKKKIKNLYHKLDLNMNTLLYVLTKNQDYDTKSIYFYNNEKLINNNYQFIEKKKDVNKFNILLREILNSIQSNEEYKKVFYWYGEKK